MRYLSTVIVILYNFVENTNQQKPREFHVSKIKLFILALQNLSYGFLILLIPGISKLYGILMLVEGYNKVVK